MKFKKGDKLLLLVCMQENHFSTEEVFGEVVSVRSKSSMYVRVWFNDRCGSWSARRQGYLTQLHQMQTLSGQVWLQKIGVPQNSDGSHNMPSVFAITRKLTERQFNARSERLRLLYASVA